MSFPTKYRGRFAPSPTGPLHFGSLVAATASYLQAKKHEGEWLIRIDDIDPPREQKGASENILKTLEAFGFEWDSEVLYQNQRLKRYQEALDELLQEDKAYYCSCSRKDILTKLGIRKGQGELIYPGFCRDGMQIKTADYSMRLRCDNTLIRFIDGIQGLQNFNIEKQIGDFILKRRDRLFSYQLASGIDDAEQNITEVMRGSDLLNCTPSQLHVQASLGLSSPEYSHLPVVVNQNGQKLSKQSHATPINVKDSSLLLYKTLKFLGQMPSIELIEANKKDIWCWAKAHWQLNLVPKKLQINLD